MESTRTASATSTTDLPRGGSPEGLFGVAVFVIESRTKEIGIRKVLGATVNSILLLVSSDFVKLVLLSTLIASPLTWLVMNNWLDNFAYRIPLGFSIFVVAGLIALGIALVTISFQAVSTALANPARSLRAE